MLAGGFALGTRCGLRLGQAAAPLRLQEPGLLQADSTPMLNREHSFFCMLMFAVPKCWVDPFSITAFRGSVRPQASLGESPHEYLSADNFTSSVLG